jgi:tetratricopeptide (TPR) repeat protein
MAVALQAVICLLAMPALQAQPAQALKEAEELYTRTAYKESLALLNQDAKDAATDFLAGRDYFMLGEFKAATDYLQRAAAEAPTNGEYMDWLGRAYGKRAETSNPFVAPGFASKARQAFEKSVQLDPRNSDALSDLFDYYLDAPGFLGGGYEKAQAVAKQIAAIDPPEGYFEQAKLAQKHREFDTAEKHLKAAIAVAPKKVGAMLAYARFLANQGRTHESDEVLAEAEKIEPEAPDIWYTRADLLIKQNRNPTEARDLLQKYLHANITVDDPPKEEAMRLLKQVGGA